MATITGTSGDDFLIGTNSDDVLQALGGLDTLIGLNGADEYQIYQSGGTHQLLINDRGTDGAIDIITGGRGLYASGSYGYQAWGSAERVGMDMIVTLPGRPSDFSTPGYGPVTVQIKRHYLGNSVEYLEADGVSYRLATGRNGTAETDIIAGSARGQTHIGYDGDDFIDAGGGNDRVIAGAGDDVIFGGEGANDLRGGGGNDFIYGGTGPDSIDGGDGQDWIETGEGDNTVDAGAGDDWIFAGTGDDTIHGGDGWDNITGFDGDDTMSGGKGGDTYRLGYDREALGTTDQWGHDVIREMGDSAIYDSTYGTYGAWRYDTLEFYGLYGPSDGNVAEAIAELSIERIGDDMLISKIDGLSSVLVEGQFGPNPDLNQVEQIALNGAYWEPVTFMVVSGEHIDIGDDRGGDAELNEFLFGTEAGDLIFSDTGYNLIWTGDGADVLLYKESDPHPFTYGSATVVSDTVMDFDVTKDQMDFSEIQHLGFNDLTISEDAEGDAVISWNSGSVEICSIYIELRGVSASELSQADHFVFAGGAAAPLAPAPTLTTGKSSVEADVLLSTDVADKFVLPDILEPAEDSFELLVQATADSEYGSGTTIDADPLTGTVEDTVIDPSQPGIDDGFLLVI